MPVYAFIDATNLHLGIKSLGWTLDYKRFRVYLSEKYGVEKAYMFLGYSAKQQRMYEFFNKAGYALEFKHVLEIENGMKGDRDVEFALKEKDPTKTGLRRGLFIVIRMLLDHEVP